MTQIQEILNKAIADSLAKLDIDYQGDILLEHPNELSHGDFSTNIAMVLAKQEGKNPRELAQSIVEQVQQQDLPEISGTELAGPGFINFSLSSEFFEQSVKEMVKQGDDFGKNKLFKGKKVLVEHSSPNLFKPFHIGHLMNNTIGESISRLYAYAGADLTTISYPSDVSLGIAKGVWQLLEDGIETLDQKESLAEKIAYLGTCYSRGVQAYDENQDIHARVREIADDIYQKKDTEAHRVYLQTRDLNIEYFKDVTKRLGSDFDNFIFESEAGVVGKKLVLEYTPKVYTESDGAVIYEGENDGLHTRVFINKDGNPTYEAKDTGLLKLKFERYTPDLSVFVTDSQQGPYFQVVKKAAGKINKEWEEKTVHATHGRMQFKGEKMSSRLGNTPLAADILDVVNQEAREKAGERELSEEQADDISLAALKYSILRTQAGRDINFDPETSLSFEGDSGPYLQYTHARSVSLLNKAHATGINPSDQRPENWSTTDLEKYFYRFPELTELAVKERHPHIIVGYITELAQLFNTWYSSTKIIDADDSHSPYKLALVKATAQIIKNGLWLLGIKAPEEM